MSRSYVSAMGASARGRIRGFGALRQVTTRRLATAPPPTSVSERFGGAPPPLSAARRPAPQLPAPALSASRLGPRSLTGQSRTSSASVASESLAAGRTPSSAAVRTRAPAGGREQGGRSRRDSSSSSSFGRRGSAGRGSGRGGSGGRRSPVQDSLDEDQRLSKVLAWSGLDSRRACETMISEGRVSVNGEVIRVPQHHVNSSSDVIEVDGKPILHAGRTKHYYFALNKPRGYTCMEKSADDPEDRMHTLDLLGNWIRDFKRKNPGETPPRLQIAGRLDINATGLVLVTNDGQWTSKVTSPAAAITREYSIRTEPKPTKSHIKRIAEGSGAVSSPEDRVQPVAVGLDSNGASDRLRIVVSDASSRQVRTLVESVGLRVNTIKRVRVGGYRMPRDLGFGNMIELKPNEIKRVLDRGADATM